MFERFSERARRVIFLAYWSARRRGASYIEPEDLLDAVIREDSGKFAVLIGQVLGTPWPTQDKTVPRRFFTEDAAQDLLRELGHVPESATAETPSEKREPVPHGDMPVSRDLKNILALAAKAAHQNKTIEPLHLLTAIVEDRESRLAQLLRDHGITRQKISHALDSGP
jgi:ATP-dependent Clp protease ATP-binding subunit ClpC